MEEIRSKVENAHHKKLDIQKANNKEMQYILTEMRIVQEQIRKEVLKEVSENTERKIQEEKQQIEALRKEVIIKHKPTRLPTQ